MTDTKQIEDLRNKFRNRVGKYIKQTFELVENGLSFRFNRLSINKIGCIKSIKKSVENGFSIEEHFEAAENIKDLFEHSTVVEETYKDKETKFETHYLCISKFQDGVYAWMNVVTWGKSEGYIGMYLSREVE